MRARAAVLWGLSGLLLLGACAPAEPPPGDPVLVWLNPRRYPLPWYPITLRRDSLERWLPLAPHQLPVLLDSLRGDTLQCQWDDTDGDGQWDTYAAALRLGRGPLATAHPDSLPRRSYRLIAVDSTGLRVRWPMAVLASARGDVRHDSLLLRHRAGRIHVLQPQGKGLWTESFPVGHTLGLGHVALQGQDGLLALPPPTQVAVVAQGPVRGILRLQHTVRLPNDTLRLTRDVELWHHLPGFAQRLALMPRADARVMTGLGLARVSDLPVEAVGSTLYAFGPWQRGQHPLGLGLVVPGGWVRRAATGGSSPYPGSRSVQLRLDSLGRAEVWAFLGTAPDAEAWERHLRPWRDALTTPVVFRVYLPEGR